MSKLVFSLLVSAIGLASAEERRQLGREPIFIGSAGRA
jgi:hypothetical protein